MLFGIVYATIRKSYNKKELKPFESSDYTKYQELLDICIKHYRVRVIPFAKEENISYAHFINASNLFDPPDNILHNFGGTNYFSRRT
jgi:hypothetical protein